MSGEIKLATELTPAEEKVLGLVADSLTNKEIASSLGISPATVKRHVENIFRKLGLRNRVEAAIHALTLRDCPDVTESGLCPLKLTLRRQRNEEKDGPFAR